MKCPICRDSYVKLSTHLSKSECGLLLSQRTMPPPREQPSFPISTIHVCAGGRQVQETTGTTHRNLPGECIPPPASQPRRSKRKRAGTTPVGIAGRRPQKAQCSANVEDAEEPGTDEGDDYLFGFQWESVETDAQNHPHMASDEEASGDAIVLPNPGTLLPEQVTASTTDPQGADAAGIREITLGKPFRPSSFVSQEGRKELKPVDRAMARLHKLCDGAGCPRYLGDKIMDLLKQEDGLLKEVEGHQGRSLLDRHITRRDALMGRLQKVTKIPYPEQIPVTLESGSKVHVCRFPFHPSLQRHLLSSPYGELDNLHVNKTMPWENLSNHPTSLEEFHDGQWYNKTLEKYAQQLGENATQYMVHPLLLYIDKTGTDKVEKNTLEPLMATSTILKSSTREQSHNWFCLGLIPSMSAKSSAQKRLEKGRQSQRSMSVREYHQCLEVLLAPLKELQNKMPTMQFRRGEQMCNFRIICPVAGVVGDNLAADILCGRTGNRTPSAARLSRRCLTTYHKADATHHSCHTVSEMVIHKLSRGALGCEFGHIGLLSIDMEDHDTPPPNSIPSFTQSLNFEVWRRHLRSLPSTSQKLHQSFLSHRMKICEEVLWNVFSSHVLYNAFSGVDFGATKGGIHRATLSDILHSVEEGVIPKLLEVFFGRMASQQLSKVDSLVKELFCGRANRSGERPHYPRVSFTRGYTGLSLLSADERVGQLFVLCLLLQMPRGREVLQDRFHIDFDWKREEAAKRFQQSRVKRKKKEEGSGHGTVVTHSLDSSSSEESDDTPSNTLDPEGASPLDDVSIKGVLKCMDLSYVWDVIRPGLGDEHASVLLETLRRTVKPSWKQHSKRLTIHGRQMDYEQMEEDQHDLSPDDMFGAPTCPTEDGTGGTAREGGNTSKVEIDAGREGCSIRLNMSQFTFLCELLLTFHSLLKYGHGDIGTPQCKRDYNESFSLMKELLVRGIDRGHGTQGWHIQKFLEMSHFHDDLIQYGFTKGYSTSTGERGLKEWAKQPAKTAQKRSDTVFSGQVCLRIHEASIMKAAIGDEVDVDRGFERSQNPSTTQESAVPEAPPVILKAYGRNFLYSREDGDVQGHLWKLGKKKGGRCRVYDFPESIGLWFEDHIEAQYLSAGVRVFTELHMGESGSRTEEGTKLIIRAHHNYQHNGPWHDFVLVLYETGGRFPCKVVCLFEHPETGDCRALVQECTTYTPIDNSSLILSRWQLESSNVGNRRRMAALQDIPVESISNRIYGIEMDTKGLAYRNQGEYFDFLWVQYCRQQWPGHFLSAHDKYRN